MGKARREAKLARRTGSIKGSATGSPSGAKGNAPAFSWRSYGQTLLKTLPKVFVLVLAAVLIQYLGILFKVPYIDSPLAQFAIVMVLWLVSSRWIYAGTAIGERQRRKP